jgi:hypothetical protein
VHPSGRGNGALALATVLGVGIAIGSTANLSAASARAAALRSPRRLGDAPSIEAGAVRRGSLPASVRVPIDVVLEPRNPAALAAFATAVSTPGDALYRHYIVTDQFASRFGPTTSTIKAVERYLGGAGLPPGQLASDHLSISLTASAGQLSKAFSTRFQRYRLPGGRIGFANVEPPLLAGAIASSIEDVIGLDTLVQEQPLALAGSTPSGPTTPRGPRPAPTSAPASGPQPCAAAKTNASASGSFTANQLASAYDFSSLYRAGDEGAGIRVAVYELAPNLTSDISGYQSCYGTDAKVIYTKVDGFNETGGTVAEPALDIEDVIGLAPKALIDVYQAPNTSTGVYDNYKAIFDDDSAKVVSVSWGICESYAGQTAIADQGVLFEQAATQGQSVLAAAGDSGSEACFQTNSSNQSLSVQDPASQPYVTAVGGTAITAIGPPLTQTVWNNNSSHAGAGGGGISASYGMPSFQSGAATSLGVINSDSSGAPCKAPAGSYCREVPDVSGDASPSSGYVFYVGGTWETVGGTSAAAPLWAAFTALADGSRTCGGTSLGFANPDLYAAASIAYASDFDDITQGNNDATGANGGLYPATTGYDMASGLGTPIGGPLAATLCSFTSASHPHTLYAAPTPEGAGTCAAPANACSLAVALVEATPRSTIALASGQYVGTWAISKAVTLKGASESTTTLDGNNAGTVLQAYPKSAATVSIKDLTIEHGEGSSCAQAASGGGLCVATGSVTVTDTAFEDNTAGSAGYGGAIANDGAGTLTVAGSTFTGNSATQYYGEGGAIDNAGGGKLVVTDSTFTDNVASLEGGAIDSGDRGTGILSVADSSFVDNKATGAGGAIDNGDRGGHGTATVADSTFESNSSGAGGGAIDNGAGTGRGWLTISDSTFADNATGTAAKNGHGSGGAIDNGDYLGIGITVVTSSTFDDNSSPGYPTLSNGQHGKNPASTLALEADILGGAPAGSKQCHGKLTDDGYNVSDDASCSFTKGTSVSASPSLDAYLGALGADGGRTETIPLQASYAAPSSGDPAYGTVARSVDTLKIVGSTIKKTSVTICSTRDQRGDSREAPGCNMGAWGGWSTVGLTASASTPVVAQAITYTAKVSTGESSFSGPVDFELNSAGTEAASCGSGSKPFNSHTHSATCVLGWPVAGSHTLYASWPGDTIEPFSIASLAVDVGKAETSTSLRTTTSEPVASQPITFDTKVVAVAPGAGAPTGTVWITDGTHKCEVSLVSGAGSCQITETAAGAYSFKATYGGHASFDSSVSSILKITVAS